MARALNKAGKGGGDQLAKLQDILLNFSNEVKNAKAGLTVGVDQKTFNTYTQQTKVELSKAYITISSQIERQSKEAELFNLNSNIWNWPRETKRRNGTTAGTVRDIIDTGYLASKSSWKVSYTQKGFKIDYKNTAPYAGIIHYGGYVRAKDGKRTMIGGRPWASIIWDRPGATYNRGAVSGAKMVDVRGIVSREIAAAIARASQGL